MKNYICTSVLFLISVVTYGQPPNWVVNENDFQYTMSFVAFVNVDGHNLANTNDKVAAFVNGECRGVTNLTYVASEDSYYAYLTVFSNNDDQQEIHFKIYDSANDRIVQVEKTQPFEINKHYGNLYQAYSIANLTLNSNAEIISFGFNDITPNDYSINGNHITISLNVGEDIKNLNGTFQLSPGAKLSIGTNPLISGENSLDFTNPIEFQVLSESQLVLNQWVVTVLLTSGSVTYYKKDAVCYAGGAIKVLFTENEADVGLYKSELIYATQTINNGETVFNNLEIGTYKVKVGGHVKEIKIHQK